jgi:hypothetical protein
VRSSLIALGSHGESAGQGHGGESSPRWSHGGEVAEPLGTKVFSHRRRQPTTKCGTVACESLRWSREGRRATWLGRGAYRAAARRGGGASDRRGGVGGWWR